MGGDSGILAFLEEDNIFCSKGKINGNKDAIFEGAKYGFAGSWVQTCLVKSSGPTEFYT